MKTIEIKRFSVGSVVKSTLYLLFIPIIGMIIFGLFSSLLLFTEDGVIAFTGILFMLLLSVLYAAIYFGILALMTVIYNWLAGKFGGLKMVIEEKE
ncbi:SoxR reducing system RseC family protein [Cytobacillus kochii]|uniref:SoxR reducing system RseC family protein n=1 Tax=Cytobacillus kochii TaxID=859143 RepID=UPI001CD43DED|nr:SoxR reducing system RseC family protein [Cytobacillus kochii]MCA1026013.1 SoxR reducing system RseC family protein [Cytobacillus kochii]MDM5207606.1 SoxR reducing system RseC family protein [Cytobacillus kochii]